MKNKQLFILSCIVLLTLFVSILNIQAHSSKSDETDEIIQSINSSLKNLVEFSQLRKEESNKNHQILQTLFTQLLTINSEIQADIKQIASELEKANQAKEAIRNLLEELKKAKEQQDKAAALTKRMLEITQAISTDAGQIEDAEKAHSILTAIVQDRTKATKLLETLKSNNRIGLVELLTQNSGGAIIEVREILNTEGIKIVFRVGRLTHCLSNRELCGGKQYSITK